MSSSLQSASRPSPRPARRRLLANELPVLAAIAVLLAAWLVLALGN